VLLDLGDIILWKFRNEISGAFRPIKKAKRILNLLFSEGSSMTPTEGRLAKGVSWKK
jgi:hypothetical protein